MVWRSNHPQPTNALPTDPSEAVPLTCNAVQQHDDGVKRLQLDGDTVQCHGDDDLHLDRVVLLGSLTGDSLICSYHTYIMCSSTLHR
jgi:hypothetical protein